MVIKELFFPINDDFVCAKISLSLQPNEKFSLLSPIYLKAEVEKDTEINKKNGNSRQ
jgi:hypothetical protein